MRKDYEYVDKATSICLTTTKAGDKVLNDLPDEVLMKGGIGLYDLMLAIQNEYFILKSESSMREWYEEYYRLYEEMFEGRTVTTWDQFVDAFTMGLVSVKKVIWD